MKKLKTALSLLLSLMLCATLIMPASASDGDICASDTAGPNVRVSETVNSEPPPERVSIEVPSALDLFYLTVKLRGAHELQKRVEDLEDYNTFTAENGFFTLKVAPDIPKSVYEQLSRAEQKKIKSLSTYQAFAYLRTIDKYEDDAEFCDLVEQLDISYRILAWHPVKAALIGFVPKGILDKLNPDQLATIGRVIAETEAYQELKAALDLVDDSYDEKQLREAYTPEEIATMYGEIESAARKIWPDGCPDLYIEFEPILADGPSELPTVSIGGN